MEGAMQVEEEVAMEVAAMELEEGAMVEEVMVVEEPSM